MTVYLASPNTQQQAEHVCDMPVLLSFACWASWLDGYQQTFKRLLIDSGAYTEFTTGKRIDIEKYKDWAARWDGIADATAWLCRIAWWDLAGVVVPYGTDGKARCGRLTLLRTVTEEELDAKIAEKKES